MHSQTAVQWKPGSYPPLRRCTTCKLVGQCWPRQSQQKNIHNKINRTKLLDTALSGSLEIIEFANVDCANADHFSTRSDGSHVSGGGFSLFDIATDDAGISTEMDQSTNLGTADGASATSAEDDLVIWLEGGLDETFSRIGYFKPKQDSLKMPSFQTSLIYWFLARGILKERR